MEIFIHPGRVLRILTIAVTTLYVMGFSVLLVGNLTTHGRLLGLRELFDLGMESNIPTWYSSSILLLCSVLLAIIALMERQRNGRNSFYWSFLSVMLLYMSADEAASLHERIATSLEYVFQGQVFRQYGWVIPGAILAVTIALVFMRFLLSLPLVTKRLFIVSAALYIGGASVLEALGRVWTARHGHANVPYTLMVTTEELLEMMGAVLLAYALMSYIATHISMVKLRFSNMETALPEDNSKAEE